MMKTRILRLSKRTISLVLSMLIMVSVISVGTLNANAWNTNSLSFGGYIKSDKSGYSSTWNTISMSGNGSNYYYMQAIVEKNKTVEFGFTDQWNQFIKGGTKTTTNATNSTTGITRNYWSGMSMSGNNASFTTPNSTYAKYIVVIQCWTSSWNARVDMIPYTDSTVNIHYNDQYGDYHKYLYAWQTYHGASSYNATNALTNYTNSVGNYELNGAYSSVPEDTRAAEGVTGHTVDWNTHNLSYRDYPSNYGEFYLKMKDGTGESKDLSISRSDVSGKSEIWVYNASNDNDTIVVTDRFALRTKINDSSVVAAYNSGTNSGYTSDTYSTFKTAYEDAADKFSAYASTQAEIDTALSTLNTAYSALVPTHTVSRTAPSNGTLQLSSNNSTFGNGPLTIAEGSNYYVKATPNDGYKIDNLTVAGSRVTAANNSTSAYTHTGTMGTSNVTASCTFAARSYSVTCGGSHVTYTTNPTTGTYGSTVNFVVAAESGYNLGEPSGIYVDKNGATQNLTINGSNGSYSFNMPAGIVTITTNATSTPRDVTVTKGTGVTSYVVDGVTYNASNTFTVSDGDPFTITSITYDTGYENNNNTTSIASVHSDQTITLTGKKINYTITKASTTNGSFTVKKSGGSSEISSANYQDTIVITPSPTNSNYEVDTVKYNDGSDHTVYLNNSTYSFTMPAHTVTVTVTFKEKKYTVTVESENTAKGTVASASKSAGNVNWVTLPAATANTGYSFSTWEITSGTGTLSSATSATAGKIKATSAVTVTARFIENDYTVNLAAQTQGTTALGTVSPSSVTAHVSTPSAQISATAKTGFAFKEWTGTSGISFASSTSSPTTLNATANGTATATYKRTKVYLDISSSTDWALGNTIENGTIAGYSAYFFSYGNNDATQFVTMSLVNGETNIYSADIPAAAISNGSYKVIFLAYKNSAPSSNWNNKLIQTNDLTPSTSDLKNKFTVTTKPSGQNYTGSWDTNAYIPDVTYSVSVTSNTGGSVSYTQNSNTTVSISAGATQSVFASLVARNIVATPVEGYYFTGWTCTGGASVASTSSASTTLTATAAGTVTATYAKRSHSISTQSAVKCTVTDLSANSGAVGDTITFTVTPNKGYEISSVTAAWDAGSKTGQSVTVTHVSGTSYSITIPGYSEVSAININATATAITPTISVEYFASADATSRTSKTSGSATTNSSKDEIIRLSNASSYPSSCTVRIKDGSTNLVTSTIGGTTTTTQTLAAGTHTLKVEVVLDGVTLTSSTVTLTVYDTVNLTLTQPSNGPTAKLTYIDNYGKTVNNYHTANTAVPAAKGTNVTVAKYSGNGSINTVYVNDAAISGTSFTINSASTVSVLFNSTWKLKGSFNSWGDDNPFTYIETANKVQTKVNITIAGSYTFKLQDGNTWYGNNGTIVDETGEGGWEFYTGDNNGNCTLNASTTGYYTFTLDITTHKLVVEMPDKPHNITINDAGHATNQYVQGATTGITGGQGVYRREVTYSFTVNSGYILDYVVVEANSATVTSTTTESEGVYTVTFTMPDYDTTIKIYIEQKSTLTITRNSGFSTFNISVVSPNNSHAHPTYTNYHIDASENGVAIDICKNSTVTYDLVYERDCSRAAVPTVTGSSITDSHSTTTNYIVTEDYTQSITGTTSSFTISSKLAWDLWGDFGNGWQAYQFNMYGDGGETATVEVNLPNYMWRYHFKIRYVGDPNNPTYFSNSGTFNNWQDSEKEFLSSTDPNCTVYTTCSGTYKFWLHYGTVNKPNVYVDYPQQTITYKVDNADYSANSHITLQENPPVQWRWQDNASSDTVNFNFTAKQGYYVSGYTVEYQDWNSNSAITSTASGIHKDNPAPHTSSESNNYTCSFTMPRNNAVVKITTAPFTTTFYSNMSSVTGTSITLVDGSGNTLQGSDLSIGDEVYIKSIATNKYFDLANNTTCYPTASQGYTGLYSDTSSGWFTSDASNNTYTKKYIVQPDAIKATVNFKHSTPTISEHTGHVTQCIAGKPFNFSTWFNKDKCTHYTYEILNAAGTQTLVSGTENTNDNGTLTVPTAVGNYKIKLTINNRKTETGATGTFTDTSNYLIIQFEAKYGSKHVTVYVDIHGNTLGANDAIRVDAVDPLTDQPVPKPSGGTTYTDTLPQNGVNHGSQSIYGKMIEIPDNNTDVKLKVSLVSSGTTKVSGTATINYHNYLENATAEESATDIWFETINYQKGAGTSDIRHKTVTSEYSSTFDINHGNKYKRIYVIKPSNFSGDNASWEHMYAHAWNNETDWHAEYYPDDGSTYGSEDRSQTASRYYLKYMGQVDGDWYYYVDVPTQYDTFMVYGYKYPHNDKTAGIAINTDTNVFRLASNTQLEAVEAVGTPEALSYYYTINFNAADGAQVIKPTVPEGTAVEVKTIDPKLSYNSTSGTVSRADGVTGMVEEAQITFTIKSNLAGYDAGNADALGTGNHPEGVETEVTTTVTITDSNDVEEIKLMAYESAVSTIDIDPQGYALIRGITTRLTGSKSGNLYTDAGFWTIDNYHTATITYAKPTVSTGYGSLSLTAQINHEPVYQSSGSANRYGFDHWEIDTSGGTSYTTIGAPLKKDAFINIDGTSYKIVYKMYEYTEVIIHYNYYTYNTMRADGKDYNFYDIDYAQSDGAETAKYTKVDDPKEISVNPYNLNYYTKDGQNYVHVLPTETAFDDTKTYYSLTVDKITPQPGVPLTGYYSLDLSGTTYSPASGEAVEGTVCYSIEENPINLNTVYGYYTKSGNTYSPATVKAPVFGTDYYVCNQIPQQYTVTYENEGSELNTPGITASNRTLMGIVTSASHSIENEFYNYIIPQNPTISSVNQDVSNKRIEISFTYTQEPRTYKIKAKGTAGQFEQISTDIDGAPIYYQSWVKLDNTNLSSLSAGTNYRWYIGDKPEDNPDDSSTFNEVYYGSEYKFRVTTDNMYIKAESGTSDNEPPASMIAYTGHNIEKTGAQQSGEKLVQNFLITDLYNPEMVDSGILPEGVSASDIDEVSFVGGGAVYFRTDIGTGLPVYSDIIDRSLANHANNTYTLNKETISKVIKQEIEGSASDDETRKQCYGTEKTSTYKINNTSTGLGYKFTPYNIYNSSTGKYTRNESVFRYSRALNGYQYIFSARMNNSSENSQTEMKVFSYYIYSYVDYSNADTDGETVYNVVFSDNCVSASTYEES